MAESVRRTEDFDRILALPRRAPVCPDGLAERMTEALKRPGGTMTLRPPQALALYEIWQHGGAFLGLDVGEGKTLVSFLAARMLGARKPVLLLPASMIQTAAEERDRLAQHWQIPTNVRLMSYSMLGLVQWAVELEAYEPDVVLADEAHFLKNRGCAVTRRVERLFYKRPGTRFVPMTGTSMQHSIHDFSHLLKWSLKLGSPAPLTEGETDDWALALDEKLQNEFERRSPGALLEFCTDEERARVAAGSLDATVAARLGFRRRLRETPGVVFSAESGTHVGIPLRIRALTYELLPTTNVHFKTLREDKVTPDGWVLWNAVDVWRHAKELALGFHQIWDPRPPDAWRNARRAWFSFVREVLSHSRTLDSPEQVAQACEAGKLPRDLLDAWREVEPTYKINEVAVWHDDSALRVAAKWMAEGPGLVWTEHVAFGRKLAEITGAKYYGAKGLADDGEHITKADAKRCAILSADANRTGRNLQTKWWRNLVTSPEEGSNKWQQMLGRTHRPGQKHHEVTVDVFLGCAEHACAWAKALAGAASVRDTTGAHNKLLSADIDWPDEMEIASWSGDRWAK